MNGLQQEAAQPPPNYRALKAVVIILGVLIVLALGALIAGMVLKLGATGPAAPPAGSAAEPYTARIAAPAGAHIAGAEIDGNRLIVHIDDGGSGTVVVLDPATGRILGRVVLEPTP